nr:polysaccharide pyruvyl transferase family protein [uncultured Butyrivibrio sp.]
MKIVITNDSIMYNRGSEAVIRGVTYICRFWYPDSEIVIVTGKEGEILKNIEEADLVVPKFDSVGGFSYLLNQTIDADVVLVTGADNYDYGFDNYHMIKINDAIFANTHARTILYDCSLNKDNLTDVIYNDMNRFSYITTRESITNKVFNEKFGEERVKYFPDPAFVLPTRKCALPFGFKEGNTIGINISNLIMGKRVGISEEIVLSNYRRVIDYILDNTNYNILLIQHIFNNGYDLEAIQKIYGFFDSCNRVSILQSELLNAMEVKYIISKLSFLITARTHASIAAYSTNVPTLVVGYSVKSLGIAYDIFGESDRYVIPIRSMKNENDLLDKFIFFLDHGDEVKEHLRNTMPDYKIRALMFGSVIT